MKLFVVLGVIFGTAVIIPVSIAWLDYRARMRALDLLRMYAERREEPPPAVVEGIASVSGRRFPAPGTEKPPTTRGGHLAHAAPNTVLAVGLAALAWWRFSASGEASPLVIAAALGALFFMAGLAARLVGAYYAPSR